MKNKLMLLLAVAAMTMMSTSCDKIKELDIVYLTLGAQGNTLKDGFLAVGEEKTYTMAEATDNQSVIDIFCFYEGGDSGNNIALASPGTGITGIFTGEDAPETWANQNTTYFILTSLTEEEFTALQEYDALIVSSFDELNARRKAKDLKAGDVWSFHTEDGYFGLLLVTNVVQGAQGKVTFTMKTVKEIE